MLRKARTACCLIVFMVSFSFFTLIANSEETKAPHIFIAKSAFTFNPVPEGKRITHTFRIENKGNAVLKIEKIKTG